MFHTSSSPITTLLLLLLLALALPSSSLGADITLSGVADFTDFVSNVNKGMAYSGSQYLGTTVYLGSDITLPESINPIGNASYNYFHGVFDGQGHVINNLTMNSSSAYVGLFGYSQGLAIRNVVLGRSCSITSSSSDSNHVYVGGIIGECIADKRECNIEDSVNMADVTFSGSLSNRHNLYLGGIVGYLYHSSSSYDAYVKNCVNYGSVTDSGTVSGNYYAHLSGIVGYSQGSSSAYSYIQNCLNYGIITHSGASTNLAIGGIVGNGTSYTYIENCVSAGKISTIKSDRIGSIVGSVGSNIYINYCYYTSDVNASRINGTGTPDSTTGTPDSSTSADSGLVNKLNSNATSCNWDKWLLNANNATVTFKMGDDKELSFSSQIILIPNPVKEGNSFLFWCKDAECTEEFDPETSSVSGSTTLYAGWASGTVTFDFGNGTAVDETFSYKTEITYPDIKKEGYTLSWSNYHELMPARDITVIAQWTPNNYTVTFDVNGGSVSETSKIVAFNEKYGDLPKPNRAGYVFFGWWFTNETNGTEMTNETIVTTPYNHTLYAHWEEATAQVEIVFSSKDLTNEDVEELIEKYTEAGFTIVKYENESGEIRVIIGFADDEEAENFIGNIKGSSEMKKIINIGFITDDTGSFSTMICPLTLFNTLFL